MDAKQAQFVGGPGDGQPVPTGGVAEIVDAKTGELKRRIWPESGTFRFGNEWHRYVHKGDGVFEHDGLAGVVAPESPEPAAQ